jgi:hypothetical protein
MRADMEQARLLGYYASLIHSAKPLQISHFGKFPWETEAEYAPKFSNVDKEAFDRIANFQFPSDN